MPDGTPLRYRRLPDGAFFDGHQLSGNGARLEFDPAGTSGELSAGDLLEIECASTVYLGTVEERRGTKAVILVEHSIDRSKLQAFGKTWG